jgi:hypothetical protein
LNDHEKSPAANRAFFLSLRAEQVFAMELFSGIYFPVVCPFDEPVSDDEGCMLKNGVN